MVMVTGDLSRRRALLQIGALSLWGGMASASRSLEAAQVKSPTQLHFHLAARGTQPPRSVGS